MELIETVTAFYYFSAFVRSSATEMPDEWDFEVLRSGSLNLLVRLIFQSLPRTIFKFEQLEEDTPYLSKKTLTRRPWVKLVKKA